MKHKKVEIVNESGKIVVAQAPVIISASRATDIPAFYAPWFFNRLEKGYLTWKNPFNGVEKYISFCNTKFIVFWSKNPLALLGYTKVLKEKGIGFYIQFTLNDYVDEGLEPNVGKTEERIDTFRRLVDEIGVGGVVWRFDPLLLSNSIGIDDLLSKIERIGDKLLGYTEKLVFSFADINIYRKVGENLKKNGIIYREWGEAEMIEFARKLQKLNSKWGYQLSTCAESINLEEYNICHNRCIDSELISRLSKNDNELQNFLFCAGKDKGQRNACGCIISKDIGRYNTCPHGCLYCYANSNPQTAMKNYQELK